MRPFSFPCFVSQDELKENCTYSNRISWEVKSSERLQGHLTRFRPVVQPRVRKLNDPEACWTSHGLTRQALAVGAMPSPLADHQEDEGLAVQVLLPLFDPIRHALGDHDRRGVGIRPHHIGHDRGIDYPQALQTVHLTVLVHHSHGV